MKGGNKLKTGSDKESGDANEGTTHFSWYLLMSIETLGLSVPVEERKKVPFGLCALLFVSNGRTLSLYVWNH